MLFRSSPYLVCMMLRGLSLIEVGRLGDAANDLACVCELARAHGEPENLGWASGGYARLAWFTRAEDELRHAIEATPADWDTKYDFELVTRLAAALRQQPQTPPRQLMHLLRPQPKPGAKPVKRVG